MIRDTLRSAMQAMKLRATANQLDHFLQRLEAGETLHRHDVWGALVDASEALRAYAQTFDPERDDEHEKRAR